MVLLTCSAPYGVGGLGRHLADETEAVRVSDRAFHVYAGGEGTGAALGSALTCFRPRLPQLLAPIPPVRFNPGLQQYLVFDRFDRMVAKHLTTAPDSTIAFSGQALRTFARARALGCTQLELISPTAHLAHVWRQHRIAAERYPFERDWLSRAHLDKALAEYEMADLIQVGSEYAWQTFVREGVPAAKLRRIPLTIDRRFARRDEAARAADDIFRIVYTGALSVVKGVPLLLDAFAALECGPAELTLVGHTGTRGMRQFMERRCADDPRIRMSPGDPLPHLQRAHVYVHPSYQDGFAYAVGEALACGVPAIVTEDTGAKERIESGVNGEVVPTDSVEAIRAALERQYRMFRERRQTTVERVPCAS